MRLWSLHPRHLDVKGLVAGWREALLAQKVLQGRTTGYRHHPQLQRFRQAPDPQAALGAFLRGLLEESVVRGYRFDATRIAEAPAGDGPRPVPPVPVAAGQLEYETAFLLAKLRERSPRDAEELAGHVAAGTVRPHPLFTVVPGPVASWEKVRSAS